MNPNFLTTISELFTRHYLGYLTCINDFVATESGLLVKMAFA